MNSRDRNKEAIEAMINFCNYQERCHSEIENKLLNFDLNNEEKESIIKELQEFNYLNEQRYTEAFIRGKHSLKGWGKNKIKAALYQKKINSQLIERSFDIVLNEEDYIQKLESLFHKKWSVLRNKSDLKTKQKLFRYLYSKGYESVLINQLLQEHIKSSQR